MKFDQIQIESRMMPKLGDDGRHALSKHGGRESIPYAVVLPKEGVTIFLYTWVDAGNNAGAMCCLFGPAIGEEGHIFEIQDGVVVPSTMNFNDWRVGGMHMRQDMKLQSADVSFQGKRVGVNLRFDAIHPAYAYGGHPKGCPNMVADNRFEQSGLVKGAVTIDGRVIPFDYTGHRDHSWGHRDWPAIQHWRWFEGQAGPDLAVHFFEIHSEGIFHLRGYIYKDGIVSEIRSVDFDYERDRALNQKSFKAVVHDAAGRTVNVYAKTFAFFAFPVRADTVMNESGMSVEIDGKHGAGWMEMSWPRSYIDYMASRSE
jgi:hypothetical protein